MNIAEVLKQQLGGEAATTLGDMAGASEGELSKIWGTGIPGNLSGPGSMTSPKVDASGVSRLLSELKSNIAELPASGGLFSKIENFFSSLSSVGSSSRLPHGTPQLAAPGGGGLGKLIFTAIAITVIAGLYINLNNSQKATKEAADEAAILLKESADAAGDIALKAVDAATQTAESGEKMLSDAAKSMKDAVGDLPNFPSIDLNSIKGQLTNIFDTMAGKLGGITDAAAAEELLPDLKDYVSQLDGLSTTVSTLPAEGKSMIIDLIKSQRDKINPILEKLTLTPGIGKTVLQVIEQIKDQLNSLVD